MFEFNTDPTTNFEVYRKEGPGNVVVGDVIALHFPKESGKWFSMLGCKGHPSACPGAPSTDNGMSTEESWYKCNNEVFKIYARNRKLGDVIRAHDNVMLYYLAEAKIIDIDSSTASCSNDATTSIPPANDSYIFSNTLELYIA